MACEAERRKTKNCVGRLGRLASRRVPIITWLPKYNTEKFLSDAIAGVTVGLTVMPQGLAYATLAGLEPQYGLYSAFMGAVVYVIFGSCKDITIGPTALMALMTHDYVQGRNADFAILLAFLSGCLQLLMACLRLGVLIDFISIPVTVGFTSATSVIIVASQLKGLLGLRISSQGFLDTLAKVFENIGDTSFWDTTMSFSCIAILLFFRKMKDIKLYTVGKKPKNYQHVIAKTIWLLSTARNAIIVIVCSAIAYKFHSPETESSPFILTGPVRSGLPPIGLPPFSTRLNNQTLTFTQMCSELGTSIVLVPIIAVLGNVAIAKAFVNGGKVDATQELLTLGICNVLGSCASSMPVTGSFSRSAVNHASGVKTPMGGLYTGILILLALSFLTPYFYFIPKASLSAVIICAVIYMIEYEVVKLMWRSSKKDLVPMFVTFFFCLAIGVEYGILLGVGTNLMFLLYPSARPTVHVDKRTTDQGAEYLLVTLGNSLYFPAVDFIKQSVGNVGIKQGSSQVPVIVDCRYILGADFTAAKGMKTLINEFSDRKQGLYFYNPRSDVVAVLKGACGDEFQYVSTQEELSYLLSTIQDKSSQQLREQTHDKSLISMALNNSEMVHRNTRGSCHDLSEVTSTLLHATAS
ncbi:sodium-independent sulfate anion transporter [Harpegnathos saltator]|uniref:Sodium-independent sulfate anion transporter n=1 Tax=Harpegnathos saltator TaxID=610380 RepID=E2BP27_HARSA|nr:sodium-independent sulfate anion transporter [Harpegnathos saltator]XP_011142539.1 sodium-independent sulfate anion transporter [Harpegnathos saltator]XP_011142540.1 sodium-independent sulfate anion transporter [Harpegnathos saltator]XP_019697807.1 sodium-independent sulfate anion transporter [Harpegnathos saltator]XP_025159201.1 sodium-independent sulfate anion transporter [Harpegnathos saltator]EFN82619.1 Sodium-independent sulfate anion transporter [Harpegnathos saltator]